MEDPTVATTTSSWRARTATWIEERYELGALTRFIDEKRVPVHRHSLWYYLGGMTLFLFIVQVVSGIMLILYYRPSAAEAYESVQYIVTRVEFGWLVRNVHSWSANLLVAVAMLHMASVIYLRAYRKPRELTWVSGAFLLFLMLGFGFSGYLLPWNELAFFATKVGTGIPGALPIIGHDIVRLLRGGDEVTGATLSRFFGLHVAILPAITTVLVGLHLLFVQQQGMSVPPSVEAKVKKGERLRETRFFPNFVLHDAVGWYLALAVLAALAAFSPWELGKKADPFASVPAGIRPEWYFLAAFQALKFLPSHVLGIEGELVGVIGFGALAAMFVVLPFLDRNTSYGRPGQWMSWLATILFTFLAMMTMLGYILA